MLTKWLAPVALAVAVAAATGEAEASTTSTRLLYHLRTRTHTRVHHKDGECNGEDESPMSVVGETAIFCVSGQACVASFSDGACPGPNEGYEGFPGAVCAVVNKDPAMGEDVYGCVVDNGGGSGGWTPSDPTNVPTENNSSCTEEDESPMSVVGETTIFCVAGQACVASISDGACPGPDEGYEGFPGAVCDAVSTDPATGEDVYGCVVAGSAGAPTGNSSISESQSGSYGGGGDVATNSSSSGVTEASASTDESESESDDKDSESGDDDDGGVATTSENPCRQQGFSPMSVVGQVIIFCVEGDPCVASNSDGVCPGPGDGYENFPGARCEVVNKDPETGEDVYGCVLDV